MSENAKLVSSPNTIRSLIIDDDPMIRESFTDLVELYFPEIKVLGMAENGGQGIRLIGETRPELVFLDVQMPDMTGFEMLGRLERIDFQTIFITSYSDYAIRAIRFNALDYLLKPIDVGELGAALRRFRLAVPGANPDHVQVALENMVTPAAADHTLIIPGHQDEIKVKLKQILRIEGERNYSYVILAGDKKKLVARTLGEFEELLSDKGFFRCHKSHLVNGQHVTALHGGEELVLSDGTRIPVARRRVADCRAWYRGLEGERMKR